MNNQSLIEPSLFGVLIQLNSIYCGINLNEIQLPEKCSFLGILREDKVISAQENPEIYSGDYILAIAIHSMMVTALKVTLKRIHSVYYSLNTCLLESRRISSKVS
nr:TrkA C-terminal domain-containing protein [Nostoc flagelliforme]